VQLEKLADIKIDDHARKNVAPGFTSWKYISDSIENKELQNIENYTIGRVATARPVGSTQPVKSTRTKFTHEEDRQLVRYVKQKAREGKKPKGQAIYLAFAQEVRTFASQPSRGCANWSQSILGTLGKHGGIVGRKPCLYSAKANLPPMGPNCHPLPQSRRSP
jgi:hypothetical protein